MRALIQRAASANVAVDGARIAEIGPGLVVFVCAMRGDTDADCEWLARKTAALRIFRDAEGRMNRALAETGGAVLVVSQFTLAAETRGNRPGFATAAAPEEGRRLYEKRAGGSMNCSPSGSGGSARRWRRASSARTWRWRSSTTVR